MFDAEHEDVEKRRAAQIEAARAFAAATYGGTVQCTLTPLERGQETTWHGRTELVSELTYEQKMVFEVIGPVYKWQAANRNRVATLDVIVDEIFARQQTADSNSSGLPLDNPPLMIEFVREAMVILGGSELQLFEMFSDILYWDDELTAAKCDELAGELRSDAQQSRALFEAGFAVACAATGTGTETSFSLSPSGNIEADVVNKLMSSTSVRRRPFDPENVSDAQNWKPEPSPLIPLFTGMRAETLLGNSNFCASLFSQLNDSIGAIPKEHLTESEPEIANEIVDEYQKAILAIAVELKTGNTLTIDDVRKSCGLN